MTALAIRADARRLPLPDGVVDLIVTSPPYFLLRSYADRGGHYDGQIGSEPTPAAFIDALIECTAEWARVLKPGGSMFVNLGDKYSGYTGPKWGNGRNPDGGERRDPTVPEGGPVDAPGQYGIPNKSLMMLPERYAIACIDRLGLIVRRDQIWWKTNPMPDSATDRTASRHEYVFHIVKPPGRYFSAVDVIREPITGHGGTDKRPALDSHDGLNHRALGRDPDQFHPLGRMPGSVWAIPSSPLILPQCRLVWDGRTERWFSTWEQGWSYMSLLARSDWGGHTGRPSLRAEVDHFAAFPAELPRRIIRGWAPEKICTVCGKPRWPVTERGQIWTGRTNSGNAKRQTAQGIGASRGHNSAGYPHTISTSRILGWACDCTPSASTLEPGLVAPMVAAWSPAEVCDICHEPRTPVTAVGYVRRQHNRPGSRTDRNPDNHRDDGSAPFGSSALRVAEIVGWICGCTPRADDGQPLEVDLVRPVVEAFSPPAICERCGQGLRPVVERPGQTGGDNNPESRNGSRSRSAIDGGQAEWEARMADPDRIVGWTCGCDPLEVGLARPLIEGFSPEQVCERCGGGRFPVTHTEYTEPAFFASGGGVGHRENTGPGRGLGLVTVTGRACECTPATDHPENRRPSATPRALDEGYGRGGEMEAARAEMMGSKSHRAGWPERLPTRVYHLDGWTPPPSKPGLVIDPFGGTGTTALVASVLGRIGLSFDLSGDYSRVARWRTADLAERARAAQKPRPAIRKPPPEPDGASTLF